MLSTFRLKYSYPIFTLIYIGFIAYQPSYVNFMESKDSNFPVTESISVYIAINSNFVVNVFFVSYFMQGAMVMAYIYNYLSE